MHRQPYKIIRNISNFTNSDQNNTHKIQSNLYMANYTQMSKTTKLT